MRGIGIVLSIALMLPLGAFGQQQEPAQSIIKSPPSWDLTPDDKQVYCFWAGEIFSLGASFCSRQQSSVTCTEWPGKRPIWVVKDNDKACDRNPSLTPL